MSPNNYTGPPDKTIIVRAPLRIPLGGGGTDLPSYWKGRGGFFISGAIDKYVTVTLAPERGAVGAPMGDFEKDVLALIGAQNREVTWTSDITPGSGLGFSSALTVAILYAVWTEREKICRPYELARRAYHIERELAPVGCQDHYAAAFGGVVACEITPHGKVKPTQILPDCLTNLWLDWFVLVDTGLRRSAAAILQHQDKKAAEGNVNVLQCLSEIELIGRESLTALERDDQKYLASLFSRHWGVKKRMSPKVTSAQIDKLYRAVSWAAGGKLIGAGGGGCFLFVNYPGKHVWLPGLRRIWFKWGKGVHRLT